VTGDKKPSDFTSAYILLIHATANASRH